MRLVTLLLNFSLSILNIWYFHIFFYIWFPLIQFKMVNNDEKRSFWSKMFNFKGWEDVYNIRVKTGFYSESDSCGLNICCQSHFLKFHSFLSILLNSSKEMRDWPTRTKCENVHILNGQFFLSVISPIRSLQSSLLFIAHLNFRSKIVGIKYEKSWFLENQKWK